MANAKTKKKAGARSTGGTTKEGAAPKPPPVEPQDDGVDTSPPEVTVSLSGRRLALIRTRYAILDATTLEGLDATYTERQCRELGDRTRAHIVLRTATRWVEKIDDARTQKKYGTLPFTEGEVSWLLTLCERLHQTIVESDLPYADALRTNLYETGKKAGETSLSGALTELRSDLGRNTLWLASLKTALQGAGKDDTHAQLRALAGWIKEQLAGRDKQLAGVLRTRGYAEASWGDLHAAATAFEKNDEARPVQAQRAADSPEVNVAEGRLVFEMRRLRKKARRARAAGRSSLQLLVPSSLAHVFSKKAEEESPEPEPEA